MNGRFINEKTWKELCLWQKRNSTVIHQPGDVKTDYKDYAHTVRSHLIFLPLSHPFGEGAIFMHKHIIRLRPRNQGFRDPSLTSSSAFVRTKALLVISFRGRRTETVLPIKIQKCFTCSDCHLLYMAIYFYCEKFMGAFVNVRIWALESYY